MKPESRPSDSKAAGQDSCSSPSGQDSQQQKAHQQSTLKKSHRSPAKEPVKETDIAGRRPSDELWIDGPRFSKPRFDSKTLQQLQKEQWVDGPAAAPYGYMDDHKKSMVERWVHEHSRYAQSPKGSKKQRSAKTGKIPQAEGESSSKSTPEHRKTRTHQEQTRRRGSPERPHKDDCSTARVDEGNNPSHASSDALFQPTPKPNVATTSEEQQDVHMEDQMEPVQMQDSCLQVSEEEILAATSGWPSANDENPLPEVDQGSSNGGSQGSHPLRVLSDDGLNLPSSFTDSRSVSVDLDCAAIGDDADFLGHVYGGLTWKLLQGTLLQRRKERRRRLYGDDLSIAVKGDILTEKLERIARLRKLTSPYFDNNNEGIPSLLVMRSGASTPTGCQYKGLRNRKHGSSLRNSLCDDCDGSTDGSDCADVTSTKSEPADLDADKYDMQKLNIKPMNGLKLEAFYNRIQKSNSSLLGSQEVSPSKTSNHDNSLFQSYSEKLDLLAKDFGLFSKSEETTVVDLEPHGHFPVENAKCACKEAVTSLKSPRCPDIGPDSTVAVSGECALPAAFLSPRLQRRLSSEGTEQSSVRTQQQRDDAACGHSEKSMCRLHRVLSSPRASPTHHPKSEHSSPKRTAVSSPKPARKTGNNYVPAAVAANVKSQVQQARTSPTSSSCGTGCCSPTRSKSSSKSSKLPLVSKVPCTNGKNCEGKPKKSQKSAAVINGSTGSSANPLCRSVSSPTTPCSADSKSDLTNGVKRAETVEPGALPSPYAMVTRARPTVRESSSGHGSSDSSSFKGVMKTVQVVQCSGTSSGYESIILRDSTPASSSQDSGSERGQRESRGRKGSRKGVQGELLSPGHLVPSY